MCGNQMICVFIALIPVIVMLAAVFADAKRIDTHERRASFLANEQAAAGIEPAAIRENLR